MSCPINDVEGKTVVQVKVPVCLTLQVDEADAADMSKDELAGLVDEVLQAIGEKTGAGSGDFCPRRWMNRIPVRFAIANYWDELPAEEMDINLVDDGMFEKEDEEE